MDETHYELHLLDSGRPAASADSLKVTRHASLEALGRAMAEIARRMEAGELELNVLGEVALDPLCSESGTTRKLTDDEWRVASAEMQRAGMVERQVPRGR